MLLHSYCTVQYIYKCLARHHAVWPPKTANSKIAVPQAGTDMTCPMQAASLLADVMAPAAIGKHQQASTRSGARVEVISQHSLAQSSSAEEATSTDVNALVATS